MKLVIMSREREIAIDIRDAQSVPDVLKVCRALGFMPDKWRAEDEC